MKFLIKWFLVYLSIRYVFQSTLQMSVLGDPSTACNDPNQQSYCADCFTLKYCNWPTSRNVSCDPNVNFCQMQDAYTAEVVNFTSTADNYCSCSSLPENYANIPDPYDEQKYLFCGTVDNDPVLEYCPKGYAFDSVTDECSICIGDGYRKTPVNCTHFYQTNDCNTTILRCPDEMYFDDIVNECQNYTTFNCKDKINGLYPDTKDCRLYYQCTNGKQGQPQSCGFGNVFNGDNLLCTSDNQSVSCTCRPILPSYVLCNDGTEVHPTQNCHRYYKCVKNPLGQFEPVVKTCPPNYLFNPQLKECAPPIMVPMCIGGLLDQVFL